MKSVISILFFLILSFAAKAQPRVGSNVADIMLPGINGATVSLSSFKGKVVVLDFWASWCRPCRESNKELRSLYAKYKDKGFEIYSISIDDNESAWNFAIKADKLVWPQVRDKEASQGDELMQTWGVRYIPATFLIDKEGKLAAVHPESGELEDLLKKLLR